MNIFKSFEIFLREPLSILRERFIQIVNVNSGITAQTPSVSVDMLENKTQITVVNSDKMYNLLSTVMYRQRKNAAQKFKGQAPKQMIIGQLLQRK